MPQILFDANMPRGLRAALPDYETAFQMGWGRLVNAELLEPRAAGFFAIVTGDRNFGYQQNLS